MIAIDWGTSSLRGYLLDDAGKVLEQRRSDQGILAAAGRFAEVLLELVGDWPGDILLCGMIGSRNGWIELPYLPCPVDTPTLAQALQPHQDPRLPGRTLWFVPGVRNPLNASAPDVMRGEETQIVGLLPALGPGRHHLVLPGTHCKWVEVEDGRIIDFVTTMTGELFALLRQHSLLGRLMDAGDALDEAAFARGIERSGEPGGVGQHLFGVRALGLFEQLSSEAAPSYLSGLLIGHELRGRGLQRGAKVHLIGSPGLANRYRLALQMLGVASELHAEALAASGLQQLLASRR